jgi:tryptophan synthase alpha chain
MSKIANAFQNGKAFIGFVTAGDPSLAKTEEFIVAMESAGADLIEIGIPFSDPIAEGEVIQKANIRALAQHTTLDKIFKTVKSIRAKTQIPLVFLTYLNPVFKYGYERFFEACKTSGVDGVIIPDLPFEEKHELSPFAKKYDVDIISLIAPTSKHRVEMIAKESTGFVYCVSSMGVTGMRSEFKTDVESTVRAIKSATNMPVAIGFGISTPEQANEFSKYADGIIVGSAIVKIIEKYGENSSPHIFDYVSKIKDAIK